MLLAATDNECTGYGTLRASNFCFPSTYWSDSRSLARMRTANIENDTSIWTNERCNRSSANIGRMKFVMRHAVIRKRCFPPCFEFNYSLQVSSQRAKNWTLQNTIWSLSNTRNFFLDSPKWHPLTFLDHTKGVNQVWVINLAKIFIYFLNVFMKNLLNFVSVLKWLYRKLYGRQYHCSSSLRFMTWNVTWTLNFEIKSDFRRSTKLFCSITRR